MTSYLLDVNVLVALMWPAHEAHAAAQGWLKGTSRGNWATCPLTQAGFVRTVSNPAFSPHAVSPGDALDVLATSLTHPRHVFWADDLPLAEALRPFRSRMTGHGQITDAYLLALAVHRRGILSTFDRAIVTLAGRETQALKHLEVIPLERTRR